MNNAATGFILSGKVNVAAIEGKIEEKVFLEVDKYFRYGFANYAVQRN